ncbi:MAG: DUF4434 domain-containing protein [Sedimentisphaerales bacterium]|nr:DUF4434 domain-containing protein [Sedimentisphaerales bacterium]
MSITRREWLSGVGRAVGAFSCGSLAGADIHAAEQVKVPQLNDPNKNQVPIKPITGSWISIQWNDKRHLYWNNVTAEYTDEQWQAAVKEAADIGIKYLVLLAVALEGKTFYDSKLGPKWKVRAEDPIGQLLDAGDRYGVKFFLSMEFLAGWHDYDKLNDKEITRKRLDIMNEVAEKYARHESFYGWYLAAEGVVSPEGFSTAALEYINTTVSELSHFYEYLSRGSQGFY